MGRELRVLGVCGGLRGNNCRSFDFAQEDNSLVGSGCVQADRVGERFQVSHPSDKNKDVARMGHPTVVVSGEGTTARTTACPSTSFRMTIHWFKGERWLH